LAIPAAALNDFAARNRTPVVVPRATLEGRAIRRFRFGAYGTAPVGDLSAAREQFLRKNAPARCFHVLSRPGFDAERRHAVITTGTGGGDSLGDTRLILLVRETTGWRVANWQFMLQG
jgi:hypothetical protein